MSGKENYFCRLCAVFKSKAKLINLLSENETQNSIRDKLKKFNISIELNVSDTIQSCAACLTCINSLNNAFEFICTVENAQKIFEDIKNNYNIVKEESHLSDIDEKYVFPETEVHDEIKIKSESTCREPRRKISKVKEKKEKLIKNTKDIPSSHQLKLTWQDYQWQCAYCESLFPNIDELKSHSVKFHKCCNPYRCTDCNIRKLKLDSFLAHVKRHRKHLKLSCYKCHKRFSKIAQARLHFKSHITTNGVCSGCNECFKTSDELDKHSVAYNRDLRVRQLPPLARQNLSESLTCYICQKIFKYKGTLSNHLLTHTDRKREYTCDKCGKRFFSKQNLSGHMMSHEDIRPFPCEICKFRFRTPGQLRLHVSIHDGLKPFECEECGRRFRLRKQLANHSIVHSDTIPYVCSYCNKGFKFKNILNQHIRQHTGVKPYSCEHCERQFTNWPNYNKHMKRRHGTNMAKRKRTSKGVYPIDPVTGEMVVYEETNKTNEWKKELLEGSRRPGRPKLNNVNVLTNCTEENSTICNSNIKNE